MINKKYGIDAIEYFDKILREESIRSTQKINNTSLNNQYSNNCLHDQCPECNGTGNKKNGEKCIHYISCPCSKCNPTY